MKERDVIVLLKVRSNMTLREIKHMFARTKLKVRKVGGWSLLSIRRVAATNIDTRRRKR